MTVNMKKIILTLVCCMALLCSSCGHKLTEQMETKAAELQAMGEIGTVEYTVTKIVKANDNAEWYKIGDRKVLFTTTSYLKAGISLDNFTMDNVVINESDKSISVTLPHAKLLSINLPPENIKLAYEKVSAIRRDFSSEERIALLQQGEADIRADIRNLGILEDAEHNATEFFSALLSQMGFEKVTINFA